MGQRGYIPLLGLRAASSLYSQAVCLITQTSICFFKHNMVEHSKIYSRLLCECRLVLFPLRCVCVFSSFTPRRVFNYSNVDKIRAPQIARDYWTRGVRLSGSFARISTRPRCPRDSQNRTETEANRSKIPSHPLDPAPDQRQIHTHTQTHSLLFWNYILSHINTKSFGLSWDSSLAFWNHTHEGQYIHI